MGDHASLQEAQRKTLAALNEILRWLAMFLGSFYGDFKFTVGK